jgi:molybdopterin converting factor small subunit
VLGFERLTVAGVKVGVVCFGALREHLPASALDNRAEVELDNGARVTDLVRVLGTPPRAVYALLVDGERATLDSDLHDGAEVTLMPPFTGGV